MVTVCGNMCCHPTNTGFARSRTVTWAATRGSSRRKTLWALAVTGVVVTAVVVTSLWYGVFGGYRTAPDSDCFAISLDQLSHNSGSFIIEVGEEGSCGPMSSAMTQYSLMAQNQTALASGKVINDTGADGVTFQNLTSTRDWLAVGDRLVISDGVASAGDRLWLALPGAYSAWDKMPFLTLAA